MTRSPLLICNVLALLVLFAASSLVAEEKSCYQNCFFQAEKKQPLRIGTFFEACMKECDRSASAEKEPGIDSCIGKCVQANWKQCCGQDCDNDHNLKYMCEEELLKCAARCCE